MHLNVVDILRTHVGHGLGGSNESWRHLRFAKGKYKGGHPVHTRAYLVPLVAFKKIIQVRKKKPFRLLKILIIT
jgi:hypothetical protein